MSGSGNSNCPIGTVGDQRKHEVSTIFEAWNVLGYGFVQDARAIGAAGLLGIVSTDSRLGFR